ncbi:hypothetical protein HMPREF3226_01543 [Prevotella corporis]|uniref:Uncharacterized protein n=1 Tax=Prevotella corporis TaxID=28128 RepID=A0A133Q727_9BACT|nr:hypothetical protein HMPREF3226_01543 [Prevotella corporis]
MVCFQVRIYEILLKVSSPIANIMFGNGCAMLIQPLVVACAF